jgi:DNA-binding MarR family transcriptional regulator
MTTASSVLDEIKQTRPFRSRGQEAAVAILRTADVVRRYMTTILEPVDVTLQQYNVLRILRGAHPEPLPTLEIGDRLIEQTPGITRLLDRLDQKGLVRRERCRTDRRMVHCWITTAGLDLLEGLDRQIQEADERCREGLSESELNALIDALANVRASYRDRQQGEAATAGAGAGKEDPRAVDALSASPAEASAR